MRAPALGPALERLTLWGTLLALLGMALLMLPWIVCVLAHDTYCAWRSGEPKPPGRHGKYLKIKE